MRFGAVYASVFTVVLLGAALLVANWKLGDGSRDPANDAGPAPEQRQDPPLAPAFSAEELTELPTTRWITNGGSLWNQRY